MPVTAEAVASVFPVRQACAVEIVLRSDRPLQAGETLEAQFPQAWLLTTGPSYSRNPQPDDPGAEHYLAFEADADGLMLENAVEPRHEVFPDGNVRHGRRLVATVAAGTLPAGAPVRLRYANTFSPYVAGTEPVALRMGGEAPATPVRLTVLPGPEVTRRLLLPSAAEPGAPLAATLVSLDAFDNASAATFRDEELVWMDGASAKRYITFRGAIRVQAPAPAPGVHRLRWGDVVSNAVVVEAGRTGPYWGDIHIHTRLSHDAQGDDPYPYARDVAALDFAGVADHYSSMGPDGHRINLAWAERHNRPGRFVTIPGYERNVASFTGHHNVYCRDVAAYAEASTLCGGCTDGESPAGIEAATEGLDPARVLVPPHHTGNGFGCPVDRAPHAAMDWTAWSGDPGLRPVVEIYSHHGQCELYCPQHALSYEFNRTRNPERRGNTSAPGPYWVQDLWLAGRRVGVFGSSDQHTGQGGRQHGGIAAVLAPALTREDVFDALRARRCYATTGERILVDFAVDGEPMGGTIRRAPGTTLSVAVTVRATALINRVEVLRHRFGVDAGFVPVLSLSPRPESLDAAATLEEAFEGPCMYYARVTQEPLTWPDMAWTSPVWVDVA